MPARHSVPPPEPQPGSPTERQICLYISEMCSELRHLAKHPKFRTISYLLDMARMESERMAKDLPD